MSEGDVPDLASSSDSEVEENFASDEPQHEVVKLPTQITDSGMPMTHDRDLMHKKGEESNLPQKDQNSGDESESSTDADDDNEEDDEEDEEDDDGIEGEHIIAHPNNADNHCLREVEDSGSQNHALQQKLEEKFMSCLQQATLAFGNGNFLSAASEYELALMMLTKNKFESGHSNRFIIKYCLGLSHINQKYNKEIREGERIFQSIVDGGDLAMRVLGYLGLAKAYLKQNRFSEAIQPLQDGIALISDGVLPGRCLWPGTSDVITETDNLPTNLKEVFEQLLSDCRNPPLPVAVCRYSECSDVVKTQMYLSDPEFKGYVQVVCIEKCTMEFHRECWREMKSKQLEKRSDKELLSCSCITPDCQSTVCRIVVFGPDGKILKMLNVEENSSKTKKPGSKYKNISVQHTKVPAQKKVTGKKAKSLAAAEEKAKVVEADDGSENRIRLGETARYRDDTRTHEGGGGGGGDGGRGGKTIHRRKSIDVAGEIGCQEKAEDVGRRGPECEASVTCVDPLVTMKRTDFVTLQKKKNEEQDPENLSKKAKKKREKEKPKKTTIPLDKFVDKVTYNDEAFELAYQEVESNPHSLWTIPPHGSYQETAPDNWIIPQNNGAYGFASTESHSNRQSDFCDTWDVRSGVISSQSAAKVSGNASVAKDSTASSSCSKQPEMPPEVEEDVKGNIMSYFEMFLEKNGPCLTEEDNVQRELEAFPGSAQLVISEAGGIANLLLQSVKFTVIDGYICLLKDAAKARLKARERRMALLSGSNFFKRFAGGIPINKPNSPTVDTVTSSSGKTVSTIVAIDPADEKCRLISATVKKSDEQMISAVTATMCPTSDSVCSKEKASSDETAMYSNLQRSVVVPPGADSAVNLNDFKSSGKNKDKLFGLSDLVVYKNQLRQKDASSLVIEKYDALDSIEGNCNLSVIEKFKMQVHEAASKERNRARLAQTTTSASVSKNDYVKSLLSDSKYVASGNVSTTASGFGCFMFTGGGIKNECNKNFKKAVEPMEKGLEQPLVVSGLLGIEDDVKNDKVAVSVNKTAKSDAYLFSFLDNDGNAFKMSNNTLKNSSAMKSTLSATANDFHFPLSSANLKLTSGTISTTAGQKFNPSTTDVLSGHTFHGLDMNSLDYEFGNDTGSALPGFNFEKVLTSGSDLFDVFGSNRRNCSGLWVVDKAINTDQSPFSPEDYDRLKRERDDLSMKYKALAEKQLQLQNRYTDELRIVTEKLNRATGQLENAEKKSRQLENESQLSKQEKKIHENELEKLQSDLIYTKASLQSANHLVEVTDRLLSETKNALLSEQEECRSVRDKYESLLNQLGRAVRGKGDRAEILFTQPSSSAFVPVTADSASRAGNRKPKQGFEKIINMLSVEFPGLSRIELSRCVQGVRVLRNNSLSGLTVQEIVAKVRDFILKEQTSKQLKKKNVVDLSYSMPSMVKYNSNNNGTFGGEVFQEEVDPCIICHEELSTEAASMLDCGHSFHTECVRTWFREQSTCPTCRNHALLPDEFPALGRTFFA